MYSKFFCVIFLSLVVGKSVADTRIDFFLSARNLANKDPFDGAPDTYVEVYYAGSEFDAYALVGKTKHIDDNNNPDWSELFNLYLYGEVASSNQRIKLEIYDSDYDFNDKIGTVEFKLNALVSTTNLNKDITPGGNGYINIKSRINSSFAKGESIDERFNHPPTEIISFPSHLPDVVAAHNKDQKL